MSKNVSAKKSTKAGKKPAKMDRRVYRTREALGDALVALMQEKAFDEITVQQVLDRAGVGRSTFYSHYVDKDDLFVSDVDDFFTLMSNMLSRRGEKSERVAPVKEFFEHVAEGQKLYRAMVETGRMHDVMELGRGHLAKGIEQRLKEIPRASGIPAKQRRIMAQAWSGAFFSLLGWWICQTSVGTPEEMDEMYHQMVWGGAAGK